MDYTIIVEGHLPHEGGRWIHLAAIRLLKAEAAAQAVNKIPAAQHGDWTTIPTLAFATHTKSLFDGYRGARGGLLRYIVVARIADVYTAWRDLPMNEAAEVRSAHRYIGEAMVGWLDARVIMLAIGG